MKFWMSLAMVFTALSNVQAATSNTVLEETLYQDYKASILTESKSNPLTKTGFSKFEQSLFVDAIWDLTEEGSPKAIEALDQFEPLHYDLVERLRLGILRIIYKRSVTLPELLEQELISTLQNKTVEIKLIYILAAYEDVLIKAGHKSVVDFAKNHSSYFDITQDEDKKNEITDDLVADIFNNTPDVTTYMNGEYVKSVKIFMFCRENRLFPCLMVMRNVHNEVVRNNDGSIWTNKALASSARGLPSYTRNGNTPAGIFTIDSVMPVADQPMSFGKYRRMILNFVPKAQNEALMKSLLPESSRNESWWQSSTTARDIGRNLFRIHGTSKMNVVPTTPYYPFMRTSGCIAQRENTYGGVTFKDQRDLLDDIMKAMDMNPNYENELKVKGILYLMEIDDLNSAVTAEDLALRGIE